MASTTALPTVPGVTAEQVERAIAVAQRVYDELGGPVRLEARLRVLADYDLDRRIEPGEAEERYESAARVLAFD
jgi:hypothetical protein